MQGKHGPDICDTSADQPIERFILPTAPTQPVTLNFGMAMPSWYDIVGLDERSNESCEGIDDAAETILGLIRDEVEAGVDYGRIVLSGFSQGEYLRLCVSASSSTLTRILETVQVFSFTIGQTRVASLP